MIFNDPFHRRLAAVLGLSALACIVLAGLLMSSGPRIRASIFDGTKLTTLKGQRLILKANQPLGKISDSRIATVPKVPVQAVASGNAVAITFKERLAYDTSYTVTIRPENLQPISYSFKTPQAAVYYMDRGSEGLANKIYSRTIEGKQTTVLNMDNINAFVAVDGALIVSTRSADYTTELRRFDLQTKEITPIKLPRVGTATHLQASPDRQSFGYSLTSKAYNPAFNSTVYIHNAQGKEIGAPTGFDKKKIQALDWRFGADGSTIVAQTFSNDTIVTSAGSDAVPVILGQGGLGGLSYDGRKAILTDANGAFELDLSSNTEKRLALPSDKKDSYVIGVAPYNNGAGHLMHWQSSDNVRSIEHISGTYGGKTKLFYTAEKGESIWAYRTSPNDKYLAVSTLKPSQDAPERILRIFDVRTGKQIARINADIISWQ
jgi:WD40 repeat protein